MYHADNVEIFFETHCVPSFPNQGLWPADFPVQSARASAGAIRDWVKVPLQLTLLELLSVPAYVTPARDIPRGARSGGLARLFWSAIGHGRALHARDNTDESVETLLPRMT